MSASGKKAHQPKGWWAHQPVAVRAAIITAVGAVIAAFVVGLPAALLSSPASTQGEAGVTRPPSASANSGTPSPAELSSPPVRTWTETAFTSSDTFADYLNAGEPLGAPLSPGQIVQVSCRVRGFKVKDGDRWWYRLASSPWNGQYYATSDVFYNTPNTTGSGINGVFVDKRVPVC